MEKSTETAVFPPSASINFACGCSMGKHCNHSCIEKANHSCKILCNYGFMVSELSKRIKEIRIAKGDSCTQAGAKVGISRQAYEKWENNATENMKLGNLLKFCDNYEVGIENLLRGAPSLKRYPDLPDKMRLIANEPTVDEQVLLTGFRDASPSRRSDMLDMARKATQEKLFTERSETQ